MPHYPSTPSVSGSNPSLRKSNSGSISSVSKLPLRSKSMGVRFLSPSKSKSPECIDTNNPDHFDAISSSDQSDAVDYCQTESSKDVRQCTLSNKDTFQRNGTGALHSPSASSDSNRAGASHSPSTSSDSNRAGASHSPGTSSDSVNGKPNVSDRKNTCKQASLGSSTKPLQLTDASQPLPKPTCTLTQTTLNTKAQSLISNLGKEQNAESAGGVKFALSAKTKSTSSERLKVSSVPLSIQRLVTCARVLPLESIKLKRNRCGKEDTEKDGCPTSDGKTDCDQKNSTPKEWADSHDSSSDKSVANLPGQVASYAAVVGAMCEGGQAGGGNDVVGDFRNQCSNVNNDVVRTGVSLEVKEAISSHFGDSGTKETVSMEVCHQTDSNNRSILPEATHTLTTPPTGAHREKEESIGDSSPSKEAVSDADSSTCLTPLPKLARRKNMELMFGRESYQRSQGNGSCLKRKYPFTFHTSTSPLSSVGCSSDSLHLEHAAKRLKQSSGEELEGEDKDGGQQVKRGRVLPTYLRNDGSSHAYAELRHDLLLQQSNGQQRMKCVCGRSDTKWVARCLPCHSTVARLKKAGLMEKMAMVDLDSPHVCQVGWWGGGGVFVQAAAGSVYR